MIRANLDCLLVWLIAAGPSTAAAQSVDQAASSVAKELVAVARKASGTRIESLMIAPSAATDGAAVRFWSTLTRALVNEQGMAVVDREAVAAALNEAALGNAPPEGALTDMAGAFGAKAVVTGTVEKVGGSFAAHARLVLVGTGKVVASATASFSDNGAGPSLEAQSLQTQLRRLADRVASGLDKLEGELRYQRVAVLPFEEIGATTRDKQLGLLVAAELMTSLQRDHGVMLVERSQLAKVIDELALGQSGLVDPAQSTEVGRLAGAQALVLGSVSEAGDRYMVNARIVGAVDGQVKSAEQVELPAGDLVALSSEAVVLRTTSGAIYRSLLLPGWGQFYNRQPLKGSLFAGTEAVAAGLAVTFHLLGQSYLKKYDRMTVPPRAQTDLDTMWDNHKGAFATRNWLLIGVVVIHAVNVVDALMSGRSFSSAMPSTSSTFSLQFQPE